MSEGKIELVDPVTESPGRLRGRRRLVISGVAALGLASGAVILRMPAGPYWSGGGPYRIGWTNDPPEMSAGSDGQPTGLSVELVKEAARRRGIALKWVRHDESSEASLRSGAVDLWPLITITPERLKAFHISAPYLDSAVSFTVRRDSNFQRVEELSGQTVGYLSGQIRTPGIIPINLQLLHQYLPGARPAPGKTPRELIARLCRKEIGAAFLEQNAVIGDLMSGDDACGNQGLAMVTDPGRRISLGVGSTMRASAAADAIRDEIDVLAANGWMADLFSRWGYLSGRSVAYVDALRISRQRERWLQTALGVFALLFLLALWQTLRYFRESTRARRAETALRLSVSESRRMEERLRENKHRLEEAQQMAHVGSFATDTLTGEMEWSEELYQIYELDPAQGSLSFNLVLANAHPDDRAMIQKTATDLMGRSGRVAFEHRLLLRDGRIKFLLVTLTSTTGADGKLKTRGTVQDITERKLAEEQKAKLEAQLFQAHKMESIGRLAGGIAHDFNNLLTVINGYSNTLMRQPESEVRKHAEQIRKAGESAASLTRQLLSFSRMEATQAEPVHLNTVVAESEEMLERLLGEHIEMKTSLEASPDEVLADPHQMQQCLMNLVLNARDAMPGGGQLTIETGNVDIAQDDVPAGSGGAPGPHVRLTVRDTGIGMDEDTRQHIFEPFFTTKEKGSGTGLGLSSVYGIVNRWQGFLKVGSVRGRGSEFSICLPLNLSPGSAETAPTASTGLTVNNAETVLVVEDQDMLREFAAEWLRTSGFEVLEARNGAEALEIIEHQGSGIHLMLTDVTMPGMSGVEVAKRAKTAYPSMKVLLMTGYADESIGRLKGGKLNGADDLIMKPFAPEALEECVRNLLHHGNGHADGTITSTPSSTSGSRE